ncbi:MAG: hypothetical protein ISS63_14080 [Desulfobacteraceae bacterium]|nr:hypothetical protein [Desulfobacteraceae bacterium]
MTLETFETDIIEVDPLVCPKCSGKMKIISVIDDEDIKKKILKHLGLWNSKPRPPPEPKDVSKKSETVIDDAFSQVAFSASEPFVPPTLNFSPQATPTTP